MVAARTLATCRGASSSFPKPRDEPTRRTLILAIRIAPALERVFLRERNARDFEQDIEHQQQRMCVANDNARYIDAGYKNLPER
jgi:hypothetical protein